MKRVRLSCGARQPGRGPRWTSSTGGRASRTSARRAAPMPSSASAARCRRRRGRRPRPRRRARPGRRAPAPRRPRRRAGRRATRRRAGGWRHGGRCAGRRACRRAAAARRVAEASEAPSSSAAQSCSPPPNGTWTASAALRAAREHRHVRRRALEQLGERRRQLRAVETRGRVDEHEVGLVRRREPDEIARGVVAREGRRPRLRPVAPRRPPMRRARSRSLRDDPREHELAAGAAQPARQSAAHGARRATAPRAPCGAARAPAADAELERGVLREDRALERLQRRGRLDPEALDERLPGRAVDLERLGLPAGAVEREHQLAAQPLAQRMLRDEGLELATSGACRPSASSASIRSSSAASRSSSSRSTAAWANDS